MITSRHRLPDDTGHALLFLLILIPILLSLGTLGVDLALLRTTQEALMSKAEEVARTVTRQLPNGELAQQRAKRTLDLLRATDQIEGTFEFDGEGTHSVTITLLSEYHFSFDSFIAAATGKHLTIPIRSVASASISPRDTVLIVMDSSAFRPRYNIASNGAITLDPAWESEERWPVAESLQSCASAIADGNSVEKRLKSLSLASRDGRRWRTQGCFNEPLLEFKLTAIRLAQESAGSGLDRLALMFADGSGVTPLMQARPLAHDSATQLGGTFEGQRSRPGGVTELRPLAPYDLSYSDCETMAHSGPYTLPIPITTRVNTHCTPHLSGQSCVAESGPAFSCLSRNGASLEEIIYLRPVTPTLRSASESANWQLALQQALEAFEQDQDDHVTHLTRGALIDSVQRRVIVLADSLPLMNPEDSRKILSQYEAKRCTLIIVAFAHSGLNASEQSRLQRAYLSLHPLFDKTASTELIVISKPSELRDRVVPLLSLGRRVLLRSANV